jgi:adenylylsulfate kinase-like enzyme
MLLLQKADSQEAPEPDDDNLRHGLNRDLGFTDADRVENIRRGKSPSCSSMPALSHYARSFLSRSPHRARQTPGEQEAAAGYPQFSTEALADRLPYFAALASLSLRS